MMPINAAFARLWFAHAAAVERVQVQDQDINGSNVGSAAISLDILVTWQITMRKVDGCDALQCAKRSAKLASQEDFQIAPSEAFLLRDVPPSVLRRGFPFARLETQRG